MNFSKTSPDAGGILACSRWLSEATPPEHRRSTTRTPVGVLAPHRYAINAHFAALPPRLCHEKSGTYHRRRMAFAPTRLLGRCRAWIGRSASGCGRRGGSCASARWPQAHALSLRLHARIEEGVFCMGCRDNQFASLPLAGGLWGVHRQCISTLRCAGIYRSPGRTSPPTDVSGGIHHVAPEVGSRIRRKIPRLIWCDAHAAGTPAGVRKNVLFSFPVVSLRSTTGYKLISLRDEEGPLL
jgi:hypothetical protein